MIQSSISRSVNNKKGNVHIVAINGDGSAVVYSSVHSSLRIYIIRVSTVNPNKHVTLLTDLIT